MYADRPRREALGRGKDRGGFFRRSTKAGMVMTRSNTQNAAGIEFSWSLASGHAQRRHSGGNYQTEKVLAPISRSFIPDLCIYSSRPVIIGTAPSLLRGSFVYSSKTSTIFCRFLYASGMTHRGRPNTKVRISRGEASLHNMEIIFLDLGRKKCRGRSSEAVEGVQIVRGRANEKCTRSFMETELRSQHSQPDPV